MNRHQTATRPTPASLLDPATRQTLERMRRQLLQQAADIERILSGAQTEKRASDARQAMVKLFRVEGLTPSASKTE